MKKPAELALMQLVLKHDGRLPSESWGRLTQQEYGYLAKWDHSGLWNFGVSLRSGWLTDEGRECFKKILDAGHAPR